MLRYLRIIDDVYNTLGSFSDPYLVDRKRFAYSLMLLDKQNLIRGKRILDLGSGIGIFAIALRKLGAAEVIGLDKFVFPEANENPYKIKNFELLKRIWENHGISVKKGDLLETLPFSDGEFDLVNCDCTIEHLLNSPKYLFIEIRRVLRTDGSFFVTTPNLSNLLRRIRFLVGRSPHWDIMDYFNRAEFFNGHRREFTVGEICDMLRSSGFDISQWRTQNSFFNWRRLFSGKKCIAQFCAIISSPFPKMREMIFVLSKKI